MLIVIVVIGILAGIYLLAAEPAIERARATDCLSDRTTIKHQYYIMRSENGYNSEDFAEAVKKDLGRSNVEGDGSTFSNICRDGGVYTCSMDEYGRFSVVCSFHDKLSVGASSPVITSWSGGDLSKLITAIDGFADGLQTDRYYKNSGNDSVAAAMQTAIKGLGLNPNGYAWYIKKDSANTVYFVVATSDTTGKKSGESVSAVRYRINTSGEGSLYNTGGTLTGTVKINNDGTITEFKAK